MGLELQIRGGRCPMVIPSLRDPIWHQGRKSHSAVLRTGGLGYSFLGFPLYFWKQAVALQKI